MKKYLALYKSSVSAREMMASMAPEQGKAEMAKWMAWGSAAGAALVDWGSPLGEAASLRGNNGEGFATGYSIVEAESMDAAKELFEAHPHFGAPGASIELLEILPMPGA